MRSWMPESRMPAGIPRSTRWPRENRALWSSTARTWRTRRSQSAGSSTMKTGALRSWTATHARARAAAPSHPRCGVSLPSAWTSGARRARPDESSASWLPGFRMSASQPSSTVLQAGRPRRRGTSPALPGESSGSPWTTRWSCWTHPVSSGRNLKTRR